MVRHLWVTDEGGDTIYKYDQDGVYLGAISLNTQNGRGRGIKVANNYIWVVDKDDLLIYKYTLSGSLVTTIPLNASNARAEGIAITSSIIVVLDSDDLVLYTYNVNTGSYLGTLPLNVDNGDGRGVANNETNYYVVDDLDNQVYVYNGSTYVTRWNLHVNNATPEGITTDGTYLWVVDRVDMGVYKYTMSGVYVSRFSLNAANSNARGIGSNVVTTSLPIAYDSASTGFSNLAASSMTISHTIGTQSNRLLVVGTQTEDASNVDCKVSSITYNGQAMTKVNETIAGTSFYMCVSLWYIVAPATGAQNIVVNWTGPVDYATAGGVSLYNAAQQGPEAQNVQIVNSGTSISTSIITLTNGAWVVDAVGSGNAGAGFTATTTGQTERYDVSTDSTAGAGSTLYVANAGTVSMAWTQAANRLAQVVAAFKPA